MTDLNPTPVEREPAGRVARAIAAEWRPMLDDAADTTPVLTYPDDVTGPTATPAGREAWGALTGAQRAAVQLLGRNADRVTVGADGGIRRARPDA